MTDTAERYRRLSADLTATLEAVPPDGWSAPTPCQGWSALDLARHLVETSALFLGFIGVAPPTGPPVEHDPVAAWAAARDAVQAALDDPATATQEFAGYAGPTTFETSVDRFLNLDLVVHRWDLARAAGLEVRLDPDDVSRVHEQARSFGDALRSEGVCGPEVEPPADADDQTRMLAFLGRRV